MTEKYNPKRSAELVAELRPLNMWLTRLMHTSDIANRLESMMAVVEVARKWRHAVCDSPADCGDGWSYHCHDCPTNKAQRALVDAADECEHRS